MILLNHMLLQNHMTNFGKLISFIVIVLVLGTAVLFISKKSVENKPNPTVTIIPTNIQPEILGNKSDLVSFSILPGAQVSGKEAVTGKVQGGYFFEANLVLKILDANKNVLKTTNGTATTDWMTSGPVDFKGNLDFTGLPAGSAYIAIENDNPSGEPANAKQILIPVVIQSLPTGWLKSPKFGLFYPKDFKIIEYYELSPGQVAQGVPETEGAPTFTATSSGNAIINWGGYQSACSVDELKNFQYGISFEACVKDLHALVYAENVRKALTPEELKLFGDFVLKNR